MANPTPDASQQKLDPSIIFATLNAHQNAAALRAGIELDVFTAIAEGNHTPQALAGRCKASDRGMRVLCDFLTIIGFLQKESGQYQLAPISAAFLDKRQPSYLGSLSQFMNSPDLMRAFHDPAELVRRGTTLLHGAGSVEPEYEGWVEFARSMAALMRMPAEFIGRLCAERKPGAIRVLDIAAGHGLFGIAAARHNPQAEIVALDWGKVLEVAKENAEAAGVADRYHLRAGDALSVQYGDGFDVVLITNFLHHFDVPTCEAVLSKVHDCLLPGGMVVTLEFVPNEDRVSPPASATFSMMMLATTPAGDAYTFSEYQRMYRAAGLQRAELMDVPDNPQRLVIGYR